MALIQQLFKKGIITKEQATSLEFEVKQRKKREEELLIEKKIASEDFLFSLKSENLKIPLKTVEVEEIPLETLELIPEETARYYQMAPLSLKENFLEAGMVYPEDLKAQEALKFLARQGKLNCRVFLISPTTFNSLLKQYRNLKMEVGKALEELKVELKKEKVPGEVEEFERLAEEAPVTKIVAVILRQAVDGQSSDIHIEPLRDKVRVRFRLIGRLHSSIFLPLRIRPALLARIKILSNLKIDETRIPQDGRFSAKIDETDIDFRVSTFPTTLGEKAALRVLNPTIGMKKFDELGLEGRNFEVAKRAIKKPHGLVLVAGPTGSGKTTTLYALLQTLNEEGVNIITLEDPVEYFIEGINQSQVRPEIGYDFARGLRHVLRQDPNVIMVGEIRDEETAFLVTHAALTGHIVLSTLHTKGALGGIPRLLDLGVRSYLIPVILNCVVAQRLVRKLCQFCKKEVKPRKEISNLILNEVENLPEQIKKEVKIPRPLKIFEPAGCKKCNKEGFAGRIGVFEVLEMSDQLSEIILKIPSPESLQQEANRQGMITMFQDSILKVINGTIPVEEALKITEEQLV